LIEDALDRSYVSAVVRDDRKVTGGGVVRTGEVEGHDRRRRVIDGDRPRMEDRAGVRLTEPRHRGNQARSRRVLTEWPE
jgi:hypothetical protein